jgi:hypothetical protein
LKCKKRQKINELKIKYNNISRLGSLSFGEGWGEDNLI